MTKNTCNTSFAETGLIRMSVSIFIHLPANGITLFFTSETMPLCIYAAFSLSTPLLLEILAASTPWPILNSIAVNTDVQASLWHVFQKSEQQVQERSWPEISLHNLAFLGDSRNCKWCDWDLRWKSIRRDHASWQRQHEQALRFDEHYRHRRNIRRDSCQGQHDRGGKTRFAQKSSKQSRYSDFYILVGLDFVPLIHPRSVS